MEIKEIIDRTCIITKKAISDIIGILERKPNAENTVILWSLTDFYAGNCISEDKDGDIKVITKREGIIGDMYR